MDATIAVLGDLPDSTVLTITPTDPSDDPDNWLHEIEYYLSICMISPRIEGDA